MRTRVLLSAAAVVFAAACGDQGDVTGTGGFASSRQIAPASGTLEQNIYALFSLYPQGITSAGLNRWNTLKRAYGVGLSDASKMRVAHDQLFRLAEWVRDMAPRMQDPPGDETRSGAAARLALYMSLYIYQGPSTQPPAYSTGTDNAVGFVTPSEGGTIVTPSTNAGVSVPAGAVDVNTIVVITENPTPYPANCSGPLPTQLCQYPKFYHFSQFPHARLNVAAKFAVCHVNHGTQRLPLADHDRFRLAHNKPANPADYTPGSTIRDQNGESIEILPLTTQTFSLCDHIHYALSEPTGLNGLLARAAVAIEDFLSPKSALAIDQGGGGMAVMFSDFNNVDPDGVPDDSVSAVSVPSDTLYPGDTVAITYTVKNVGTATAPTVLASIGLTPIVFTHVPPTTTLTQAGVMPLVPGQQITLTTTAIIPLSASAGSYTLSVTVGSDTAFPDAQLGNNGGSGVITVGYQPPVILAKKKNLGGR